MAKKFECVRDCTYQIPGSDYARYYAIGDILTVADDVKPPKHFREFKGKTPPPRPEPTGPEGYEDNDPVNAALAGKKIPLSAITKPTVPAPTPSPKK